MSDKSSTSKSTIEAAARAMREVNLRLSNDAASQEWREKPVPPLLMSLAEAALNAVGYAALLDVAEAAQEVCRTKAVYTVTLEGLDVADAGETLERWSRSVAAAKADHERAIDLLNDLLPQDHREGA